jgi:membrane protein YdbS with pleckstrin-like domain
MSHVRKARVLTERRRIWGLLAAVVLIAASFGLETHNWSGVPESVTTALLFVGLLTLVGLLLVRPHR